METLSSPPSLSSWTRVSGNKQWNFLAKLPSLAERKNSMPKLANSPVVKSVRNADASVCYWLRLCYCVKTVSGRIGRRVSFTDLTASSSYSPPGFCDFSYASYSRSETVNTERASQPKGNPWHQERRRGKKRERKEGKRKCSQERRRWPERKLNSLFPLRMWLSVHFPAKENDQRDILLSPPTLSPEVKVGRIRCYIYSRKKMEHERMT